ncbi:MAG TPA: hypothetical protein VGO90_01600 [Chthoniobacteraceae bacterium]|jgi:hypothetical protein|nr:hypothetical protein [Chthoniobacteraceae bacterium]
MTSIHQEWSIQNRGNCCAVSGREFSDGEFFYTLLFHDKAGFRREDLSEEAWKARNENIQPFSMWRAKFETPAPAPPETLGRQTAEDLLRRYMDEPSPQHAAARYLLAAMLERKKLLREIETRRVDDTVMRVFEHTKTGEVFVVPDPQLRLDQIEAVQQEVAALLSPG